MYGTCAILVGTAVFSVIITFTSLEIKYILRIITVLEREFKEIQRIFADSEF
jgi:hypothetical protein